MTTIWVDQKRYEVDGRQNLLHACLSIGFDIPYFCWHPALHSVGACRQCAVKTFKDEHDTRGKIVMSCMTPVTEGMRVSVSDPDVLAFRKSVIEWLMINHPHDCPICDEGGHCHLQDMTVMAAHAYRSYRFKKRTFRNQYLGPFVNHEMNRCIQCYRCVRYYRDYSGADDFNVFGAHDSLYFGRHHDGTLESELSGNLVEVCPTGVFTDKTLKAHYTRKWDLQFGPSVCVHCSVGCNTIAGERYGSLRCILNRYHRDINEYFICDRGRFGYEFVNAPTRIRRSFVSRDGQADYLSRQAIVDTIGPLLARKERVLGIGSPRASLETNFMLRHLVGSAHFSTGLSAIDLVNCLTAINILKSGPAASATPRELSESDGILILGEDLAQVAPRLALSIHQTTRLKAVDEAEQMKVPGWHDSAVRTLMGQPRSPLTIATPYASKLDRIATNVLRLAPNQISALGFTIAEIIRNQPTDRGLSPEIISSANPIAQALMSAKRPVIVCGMTLRCKEIMEASANIAWALCERHTPAKLCFVFPECNTAGVAMIGGLSLEEAFDRVKNGSIDTVLVVENDIARRSVAGEALLRTAEDVIVLDHSATATTDAARYVLPAATFAESDGTLVNGELRAQRHIRALIGDQEVRESWKWLRDLAVMTGDSAVESWKTFPDVVAALAKSDPLFSQLVLLTPGPPRGIPIPRQPHRYSGRTAITAHLSVDEPKPPTDADSPLSFSMEGYPGIPPSEWIPFYWSPGWNSVQALKRYQSEIGGQLKFPEPKVCLSAEPSATAKASYFNYRWDSKSAPKDHYLLVPMVRAFGSEPMSALSPSIAERAGPGYVLVSRLDAATLSLAEGDSVSITVSGSSVSVPVRISPDMPKGLLACPVEIMEERRLSGYCQMTKVNS